MRSITQRIMFAIFFVTLFCSIVNGTLQIQEAPSVRTVFPTNVTPTSATLNGYVNPNGSETYAYFISCDVPGSASFFNNTPEQNVGAGTTEVPVSYTLTGLTPGRPYSYQLVARVGNGYASGSCTTFSTPATQEPPATLGPPPTLPGVMGAPSVQTMPATNVSQTGATLNGSVNANSLDTTVDFVSCDSQGSASYFPHTSTQLLSGTQTQSVWSQLSGLNPGTTYRFAVRATNSAGNQVGSCLTFTTSGAGAGQTAPPLPGVIGAPSVQTLPATNVTGTSARLNASVNANSLATSVSFVSCDPTSSPGYFSATSFQNVTGTLTTTVSFTLSELRPGVTHNYKARATNAAGTMDGNCVIFVTPSTQTTPQATLPPVTQLPVTATAPPIITSAPGLPPAQPVNRPPMANAGSDKNVAAGSVVNFDGSASTDPDGDALTYSWDFGDGQTGSGVRPAHRYDKGGEYPVSLTVSDGMVSDTVYITIFVQGKSGFQFDNNMLIMGGIALVVLLVVIIIVALSGRKKQPPRIYRSSR